MTHSAPTSAIPVLSIRELKKVYPSRKRGPVTAIDGVSFDVSPGELVGLLGPNGAGKTTTIKSICTLIRPTSGQIEIAGVDAIRHPRAAVEFMAAVLEGNRNIYWRMTAAENLELFAGLHGIKASKIRSSITELLERFRLTEKAKTEARALSRGMQQKLAVACAFIKKTPVLLLDEPTLGLDVETSYELRESLKQMAAEEGRTILVSSHDMAVVQDICNRVVIIDHGKIVTDDKVSNLLDLFRARAFTFTVAGELPQDCRDEISQRFPQFELEFDGHSTKIEAEIAEGKHLYELMNIFERAGADMQGLSQNEPNLEEIFLKVVAGR